MRNITSPASLPTTNEPERLYNILDDLRVGVTITSNPYNLELDHLFQMAARVNKKRGFLFVSKLLGKHIPVHATLSLASGAVLGCLYEALILGNKSVKLPVDELQSAFASTEQADLLYQRLIDKKIKVDEPTLFIGFAETATALGHSMFDAFEGEVAFLHTTREQIDTLESLISFEEEHSHAVSHRCYAADSELYSRASRIVLVDDEMTTGNTSLNIIKEIHERFGHRDFVVASLLDWRSSEDRERFAKLESELNIRIRCLSLLEGTISVEGTPVDKQDMFPKREASNYTLHTHDLSRFFEHLNVPISQATETDLPYLKHTGRFGLSGAQSDALQKDISHAADYLVSQRKGKRILCLGTGEFMYIPMRMASLMGEEVYYQSTTRSPIHAIHRDQYAVSSAYRFDSLDDPAVANFIYNVAPGTYDEAFIFIERELDGEHRKSFERALALMGIPKVNLVYFSTGYRSGHIESPSPMGSYKPDDVVFLLKDLSSLDLERGTEDREEAIQTGTHYSEMLPVEYRPTDEYIRLFHETLDQSARQVAQAVAVVSEQIVSKRGTSLVLVSLARAGTPVGVLIKRYIKAMYEKDLSHYSISIIRGKGIDENALKYILQKHPGSDIQFIDGWTGKGAIRKVLIQACESFEHKYGVKLNDDLAVLADPGCCCATYGTRDDFLIPSACLNSTVSGLMSRTVLRDDLIGPNDFHGAKYYREWEKDDLSNLYVDTIECYFDLVKQEARVIADRLLGEQGEGAVTWKGEQDIRRIQQDYGIADINLIKPGVGETTRVLLRRVPWKILVNDLNNPNLSLLLLLASERGVTIEVYPGLTYSCCGIIKPLREE
jgi:adenine/guanine phosphoribosyltransferase-like PRPP-binding protein